MVVASEIDEEMCHELLKAQTSPPVPGRTWAAKRRRPDLQRRRPNLRLKKPYCSAPPDKCVLVAMGLTILERGILPERPAFMVKAGQRGGGKTTSINMVATAATGKAAAASAWASDEEERCKNIFSIYMEAPPVVCFDNIPRGAIISSPSIEKALTSPSYSDRVLGVNDRATVAASTILAFTGNNISPRGDMASRTLVARINVDRPDPENRTFVHPLPLDWTIANRGRILRALYTVLLANPQLGKRLKGDEASTRFKTWWTVVGSAIEHAARLAGIQIGDGDDAVPFTFSKLFAVAEEGDEDLATNADVISEINRLYPNGEEFTSADLASRVASVAGDVTFGALHDYLTPKGGTTVTKGYAGYRLRTVLSSDPVAATRHCASTPIRLIAATCTPVSIRRKGS
jgi:hypothetical protein